MASPGQGPASPVYCDSCGERTATPPLCEDCRADRVAGLAGVVGDGWMLSNAQGVWLLAEVGRLRDTLTRRGAEYDGVRGQVQRMRDWADKMEAEAPKPAPGGFFADEVRRVLDGGQ